jgi:hypothetical protein
MQTGDSILLDYYPGGGGFYPNGNYNLDRISTINIAAGQRRIFYLKTNGPFSKNGITWIESVGHPGYLIYTYSGNMSGGYFQQGFCLDQIPRDFFTMLTCFEHGNQKVYFDSCSHQFASTSSCINYTDSCNYWNICGGTEESTLFTSFAIEPNPVSGEIRINFISDFNADAKFIIYYLNGREAIRISEVKISPGNNTLQINVRGLANDLYILECQTHKGTISRKVVISK